MSPRVLPALADPAGTRASTRETLSGSSSVEGSTTRWIMASACRRSSGGPMMTMRSDGKSWMSGPGLKNTLPARLTATMDTFASDRRGTSLMV
ncbi:MAG: hypothetical protein BWX71_02308 [Deltaproteobacteria bacterium ADurb.Bin072]|nr:MAG: hypothetical protein BWX71_02308 [Deltaproteobacteria bacterium ADurb.Bin072]